MPTSRGNPDDIVRALADPERIAIAGLLARADRTADELAAGLELARRRVMAQLRKLPAPGGVAVAAGPPTFRLDVAPLRQAAEFVGPPRDAGLALGAASDNEEHILKTFFRNGRLTEIPMKRSKRRIVLERLALEFEPGRRYDEKEVDAIVGVFFNDHAALRRYLVDEGFLDRDHGVYWRTGGRVDVD